MFHRVAFSSIVLTLSAFAQVTLSPGQVSMGALAGSTTPIVQTVTVLASGPSTTFDCRRAILQFAGWMAVRQPGIRNYSRHTHAHGKSVEPGCGNLYGSGYRRCRTAAYRGVGKCSLHDRFCNRRQRSGSQSVQFDLRRLIGGDSPDFIRDRTRQAFPAPRSSMPSQIRPVTG